MMSDDHLYIPHRLIILSSSSSYPDTRQCLDYHARPKARFQRPTSRHQHSSISSHADLHPGCINPNAKSNPGVRRRAAICGTVPESQNCQRAPASLS